MPCVTRVTVLYPPLAEGDTGVVTYGDAAGGGPGVQVQPKAERDVRFVVGVEGDRDGRALDLPDTRGFDVVPGPFAVLGLLTPVVAEAGKPFPVTLEARDRSGNVVPAVEGAVSLTAEGGDLKTDARRAFGAGGTGQASGKVTLTRTGVRLLKATCNGVAAEQSVVVSRSAQVADGAKPKATAYQDGNTYVLGNAHVRLLVPRNDFGYGVAFLEAERGDQWKRVGAFPSLGELRVGAQGKPAHRMPVWLSEAKPGSATDAAQLVLSGAVEAAGVQWDLSVLCVLSDGAKHVDLHCTATPKADAKLRAFYAPPFYAGDGSFGAAKATALFPGLEYRTADEVSSGDYGIVPPFSDRQVPHPYKVTMPMVAVADGDVCAAVFWDPDQKWDGVHACPSACFASPERWENRASHLLALFAPAELDGLPENARELPEPRAVVAGKPLRACLESASSGRRLGGRSSR